MFCMNQLTLKSLMIFFPNTASICQSIEYPAILWSPVKIGTNLINHFKKRLACINGTVGKKRKHSLSCPEIKEQ